MEADLLLTMTNNTALLTSEVTRAENYICASFSSGKTHAAVCIHVGYVNVMVTSSAAHKAWKGSGKFFRDMTEARKHYKSADMQEILTAADLLNA